MNYYIVSPNVYNDGNYEHYLDEMRDKKIVILGWSQGDGRCAKMFFEMQIGDCVMVARGANRNKQIFFSGIISSESKPYTASGESQYRKLSHFTELEWYKIPFNEKCAYGAANRIPSIYQLKPENLYDKHIIELINKIMDEKTPNVYSLKDIANWSKVDSDVSIPNIQRGLVWKPRQVELLWDSILRGFPIGSFMLSDTNDYKYYLMDGQQRYNAISLGYNELNTDDDPDAVLWLDLKPDNNDMSTRKYWIRVTTKSHPWGYAGNDDCSVLNASERRDAMKKYGLEDKNIYIDKVSLTKTFPYKSVFPIPLCWVLKASLDNKENFVQDIKDKINNNAIYKLPQKEYPNEIIGNYYETFKKVVNYRVSANILSKEVIENESKEDVTQQPEAISNLEVLFRRTGTGGTAITQAELNYSAIKAYWPSSLKDENDKIALNKMSPSTLIMLAFRLALSDDKQLKNELPITRIRNIAKERGTDYDKICDLYGIDSNNGEKQNGDSEIKRIMNNVNSWLTSNNTPNFLQTSIVRNSPDVYLLLMYFAKNNASEDIGLLLQSLSFYIHWFSEAKNRKACVNIIYQKCKQYGTNFDMFKNALCEALSECIRKGLIITLYSSTEVNAFFSEDIFSKDELNWRPWNKNDQPWWNFWHIVSYNREILLYAQRQYLSKNFRLYDPAKQDMWDSYNRPWDYDHIVPQNWINGKRSKYREYCKAWLNNNGNFAAIPFEKNRSKNANADWSEYTNHAKCLFFNQDTSTINSNITHDKAMSKKFAQLTYERLKKIYEQCYTGLFEQIYKMSNNNNLIDGSLIKKRKQLFEDIKQHLGDECKCYFVSGNKEFEINRDIDWCQPWVSVGIVKGDYYYAVCWDCSDNIEIGIRKRPDIEAINKDKIISKTYDDFTIYNNGWWYIEKSVKGETDAQYFINAITSLKS